MTEFFYKAFENTSYPCYWLGRDGVFWANRTAGKEDGLGGETEDVRRLLEALAAETSWPGGEGKELEEAWPDNGPASPQKSLLRSALQMRGIEVLPHQDGLFAAGHGVEQMPVNALSGGLRGPVSDILSALQALARRLENSRLEEGDEVFFNECLESIQKNEYFLLRLAYNVELFDLTKTKPAGDKTLEISSFVDSLCKKSKNTFVKQGVQLETDITPEVLPVKAEGRILGHVIMNLMRNCLSYTKEGNQVSVALKKVGRRAVLTIRDKGLGIRTEALPHVFTPYYSAPPYMDSPERPGLGLGLALVRNAMWALGGTVAVESAFGEGTSVTLALPLAEVEEMQFGSGGDDYNDYFSDSQSPIYIQLCGYCPLPVM